MTKATVPAIISIAVFLAMASASFAFSVTVPESTVNAKAIVETAVPIKIASVQQDTLTATIENAKPWMSLNETQFTIQAGRTKDIKLTVSPPADIILGLYSVPVTFRSILTGEIHTSTIFVSIRKGDVLDIEKISITGDLEPLGSAVVQVYTKNYKPSSVDGASLFVRVSSPTQIINEYTRGLPRVDPDQAVKSDFSLFFDKNAQPGTYEVYASIRYLDEFYEYRQTFDVQQKAVIQKESGKSPTLFGYEKKIVLTNNGNTAGEEFVTEYLSSFEASFFSGDAPTIKSSGVYTWMVRNIQPGETRYIIYRVDYTPIFIFIIAVIIAAWIFFFKLRTVRIKKYIIHKKRLEAGEEFTVAVEVANKLGGKMDVSVSDFVPAVFGVKDAEGVRPMRKKTHAGTELTWHVKELHMNEARVLTYKIVPVFGVHGTLKLPRASTQFKWRNRELRNSSGTPAVGLSAEGAEEMVGKLIRRKK